MASYEAFGEYVSNHTPEGWEDFFESIPEVLNDIDVKLRKEAEDGVIIYPPIEDVFSAFSVKPEDIKVVLIGQDPYHTPGAACGLAFSLPPDRTKIQLSLRQIHKAMVYDDIDHNSSCDLTPWVEQGVFLINTALTVRNGSPNSHTKKLQVWKEFTRSLFEYLNTACPHIIVIAWGGAAKVHIKRFDSDRHKFITETHPAYAQYNKAAGAQFVEHQPFSRANEMMVEWGIDPIDWGL